MGTCGWTRVFGVLTLPLPYHVTLGLINVQEAKMVIISFLRNT